MEIIFRQGKTAENKLFSLLDAYGIEACVLKQIVFARDRSRITKKSHYHTSCEIHMIERGYQIYEVAGKHMRVNADEFLLIPPLFPHVAKEDAPETEKYAFSLRVRENSPFASIPAVTVAPLPSFLLSTIRAIALEGKRHLPLYPDMMEVRVWETLVQIFREAAHLPPTFVAATTEENERVLLVKQYIDDNVRRGVSLSELASYACIGEKQLERLFQAELGMTVMGYVRQKRCREIEALLADPALSLREISDAMHFSNEYHFSAYFKKYAGMPPGAYRKAMMK